LRYFFFSNFSRVTEDQETQKIEKVGKKPFIHLTFDRHINREPKTVD